MPKPAPCRAHSSPQYLISGCERVSTTTPTFIPFVSAIFPGASAARTGRDRVANRIADVRPTPAVVITLPRSRRRCRRSDRFICGLLLLCAADGGWVSEEPSNTRPHRAGGAILDKQF